MNARHPVHLVLGLLLWCVWFVAVYGGLSVGCATLPEGELAQVFNRLNLSLLALTLLFVLVLAALAAWCWKQAGRTHGQPRFLARVAAALYLLSAVATLATGAPLLWLLPCF